MASARSIGCRFAMCAAGLGALGGCSTTTTVVRSDQLPDLAESTARYPEGWHDAVAPGGRKLVLKGRIINIAVKREGAQGAREDTFTAPFRAVVESGSTRVTDHAHEELYALGEIRAVKVEHTNAELRLAAGGVLIATTAVPLVLAAYCFSQNQFSGVGGGSLDLFFVGVAAAAVAPAPLIAGVAVIATQPGDPRKASRPAASLDLGAPGARLRFAF